MLCQHLQDHAGDPAPRGRRRRSRSPPGPTPAAQQPKGPGERREGRTSPQRPTSPASGANPRPEEEPRAAGSGPGPGPDPGGQRWTRSTSPRGQAAVTQRREEPGHTTKAPDAGGRERRPPDCGPRPAASAAAPGPGEGRVRRGDPSGPALRRSATAPPPIPPAGPAAQGGAARRYRVGGGWAQPRPLGGGGLSKRKHDAGGVRQRDLAGLAPRSRERWSLPASAAGWGAVAACGWPGPARPGLLIVLLLRSRLLRVTCLRAGSPAGAATGTSRAPGSGCRSPEPAG